MDLDRLLARFPDPHALDAEYVTRALLQVQYLPHIKKEGEELPPIFSSESFDLEAARAVSGMKPVHASWIELRTRRFDGLVRRLGVPNPVPYAKLVLHVRAHWSHLVARLGSEQSQIKPEWHADGRLLQMDYVEKSEEHHQYTLLAQGKQYLVKADISNCFPSIYSHSLDWALRGKRVAKAWAKGRRKPPSWEAKLDQVARNCVNQETKGLLIGPAVSNLLAEIVLQKIDGELSSVPFVRFIDDYSAYCSSREEAEDFIVDLQKALSVYRLDLNTRKTKIVSLRDGIGDEWMGDVLSHLPSTKSDLAAARFLQQAELLARQHPSESVLKFASKTLLGSDDRSEAGSLYLVDELIRLSQFHSHLLPILSREIAKVGHLGSGYRERLAEPLRAQLLRAARARETDSVLWLLYIIRSQLGRALELKAVDPILDLEDDLIWIAVGVLDRRRSGRVARRIREVEYVDEMDWQAHWLARYEYWRIGLLEDKDLFYEEYEWMDVLRMKGVSFSDLS